MSNRQFGWVGLPQLLLNWHLSRSLPARFRGQYVCVCVFVFVCMCVWVIVFVCVCVCVCVL